MREFDPENPLTRREMSEIDDGSARLGFLGLLAGVAIAVIMGALFWNMSGGTNSTAMNAGPGVTTGSAPSAPPPPAFNKDGAGNKDSSTSR
jgi:hypothetical protein